MRGYITIDSERCKGCGLCISVCPAKVIEFSHRYNSKGYHPAVYKGNGCIACGFCYLTCPDVCITVFREVQKKVNVKV
ncbi:MULTISPECIES: ferredoxin family protein [Thermotoga]|jgi:2-oxoglutarate ferredoxin oxidoreductase subunit delta|uniref:4Fe-4S ferredoxin, iron-sulfur binding domain protein n=1 Tax=Thermotoga petrophila (strain ATCC BAA-488 / DSM 13995 / JCM 10881 / RKU-1) TaxID=390874 RepID=A5ILI9_THEP1|nr:MULTISPECIES: ferredoxin family protein [Thermotoga]ABQ47062.1 4Fe-4S ferredoxin, iron-sulfur binding domain protein [Thermotoga petrophila RKU-1]KAF2960677.1 tungsten formylmethanofuran dehydrogenase [Thermotoga sp. 38H-to]KHC92328.1 4Fe-4S ferredoxin iron-sulfur binding domain-containing protein [Thermotoga sp. Mc24]